MTALAQPRAKPIVEDADVLPYMELLLGCLCDALEQSPAGVPCTCSLLPGDTIALDYCNCASADHNCGQAWVRLETSMIGANVYNSVYARSALQTARCVALMSHRMQMGVVRCVPGLSADGTPPSEWDMAEAVRYQMGDFAAMRRALDCCFSLDKRREWMFERYQPIGPGGGCVGGSCTFTYRVL